MRATRHILATVLPVALIALLGASLPASAQNQPQTQPQNQPPTAPAPAAEDFSQEKIEAFADAAIEVQRVKTDFDARAEGVQDQQDLAQLHQEAQTQALQAVESSGLSPEEYSAIIQAANQDPQLYAMIVDLMEQRSAQ